MTVVPFLRTFLYEDILPWTEGGKAAISARISARDRDEVEVFFCIHIVYHMCNEKAIGKLRLSA